MASKCQINPVSSRCCIRGTKGCDVKHEAVSSTGTLIVRASSVDEFAVVGTLLADEADADEDLDDIEDDLEDEDDEDEDDEDEDEDDEDEEDIEDAETE